MVGTRQLARVLDHAAAARTKVVLVGDPRQLPEIDAGGLLRGLGARMPTIRLTENRRQRESWERDALAHLRDGHVDDAVAAYQQHGRIRTDQTAPAARNAMTADWWAATLAGDRVLMLATRWSDVDDLNARARAHLQEAAKLTGPVLTVDERPYQAGDRIMTLRNDRRLGVRNGTCATITAVDTRQREMTVRTDTGTELTLPARYLDAGHVRHAYATTIHKAQGQTTDRAFVLGSDTLYQEAGYVALSRGRAENRIYLVGSEPRPEAHAHRSHTARTRPSPHPSTPPQPRPSTRRRRRHRPSTPSDKKSETSKIGEGASRAVTRGCPRPRHDEIESLTTMRQQNLEDIARLEATSQRSTRNAVGDNATNDEDAGSCSPPTSTTRPARSKTRPGNRTRAPSRERTGRSTSRHIYDEMQELPRSNTRSTFASTNSSTPTSPTLPYTSKSSALHPKIGQASRDGAQAADYVEHYRADRYITDPHRPLGNAAASTHDTSKNSQHKSASPTPRDRPRRRNHVKTRRATLDGSRAHELPFRPFQLRK